MKIVDIFGNIVDNMRATGVITNISEANGITTVTSVNSLKINEVITIGDVDYIIKSANSTQFTVEGTGITATVWKAKAPYYDYGHPIEIFKTLTAKDANDTFKYQKYPLIYFLMDFKEKRDIYNVSVEDLTIIIMTETLDTFNALNRYNNTFVPILHPLYELFLKQLYRSNYVQSDDYNHTKIDKLYWGKEDYFGNMANIGNDFLDAVVIDGLNLNLTDCK